MEKHKWYRRRANGPRCTTEPYDLDFKKKLVNQYLQGNQSIRAVAGEYGIPRGSLCNWLRFSNKQVNDIQYIQPLKAMKRKESPKSRKTTARDLSKEALDQSKLKIEALELLIEQAEKKYKISIRKKSGTKRSKK